MARIPKNADAGTVKAAVRANAAANAKAKAAAKAAAKAGRAENATGSSTGSPSTRTRYAKTGARLVTGVVVLAIGVATVTAASALALPQVSHGVPSVTVVPDASPQTLACPGPLVSLADSSGQSATKVASVGTTTLVAGATPFGTPLSSANLTQTDAAGAASGASQPTGITAAGATGILVSGSQSQQVSNGDLVGLASSACAETSADSWLAAGSTTTGRTSFVVLTNPTEVASTVNLTIFGETGLVTAPGTSGITVAPRSQRVLSLAGFAPNVVSPVIHVVSTGGNVLASLQQSVVRSLTPGGVDVAGPTQAPATTQTIAGVQIVSTSAIAERAADPASSDLPAALRVYVPSAEGATLAVTFKSETLGVADISVNYTATGGLVTDFPLPSLTDDSYSVSVVSDKPVVVGVRSAVVSGGVDFAWTGSAPSLNGSFLVSSATGPNPRLMLANSGVADAAVTVTQAVASPQASDTVSLTVAANSAAGVSLQPNTTYTVTTTAPITAAIGYLGDGLISSFTISPPSPLASPLTLYPGN
ncbi:DUF5719 family protein [Subtercola vilae]|uniref:Large extracellular alpha-helical protein n=1 Tax=Subtercola vilae TaxID=2056433 RepID=A0A4T2C5V7_9MICO|nr:DUF5719 family protein [Subtercola vilae]TIH37826.1 hypothetical protein D4765_07380 [Subtercola vilae]